MKRKGFWISAGLLVVPVVIFYLLSSGVQNFKKLPVLGTKIPPDGVHQKDTLYYTLPDYRVTDQTGKTISQSSFHDRIYVANFFYTNRDDDATMNRRLSQVYEKYLEFTEVQFISFCLNPENTMLPDLAKYAQKYKADTTNIWHFVTGNKDSILHIQQGFLLPAPFKTDTIQNNQQLFLVDKQNRIRGIYDSASEADVLQLQDDLKVLLYEYHKPGL